MTALRASANTDNGTVSTLRKIVEDSRLGKIWRLCERLQCYSIYTPLQREQCALTDSLTCDCNVLSHNQAQQRIPRHPRRVRWKLLAKHETNAFKRTKEQCTILKKNVGTVHDQISGRLTDSSLEFITGNRARKLGSFGGKLCYVPISAKICVIRYAFMFSNNPQKGRIKGRYLSWFCNARINFWYTYFHDSN